MNKIKLISYDVLIQADFYFITFSMYFQAKIDIRCVSCYIYSICVNIFATKLGFWCCALFDGFDIKLFA